MTLQCYRCETWPCACDDAQALILGDCVEAMAPMPENSVGAIVCDPPYGLEFMGKEWDKLGATVANQSDTPGWTNGSGEWVAGAKGPFGGNGNRVRYGKSVQAMQHWHHAWAAAALRVAKPGTHLLAFGGDRTHHRLMVALEDAGWEIRTCVYWVFGSGFPKSLSVGKAIDKEAGAEREVVGRLSSPCGSPGTVMQTGLCQDATITAPATPAAKQWDGWGTALKPAVEIIVMCRKPLDGTVAENVQKWGVGALNVDACRVGTDELPEQKASEARLGTFERSNMVTPKRVGRYPSTLIHDGSDEVVGFFPETGTSSAHLRHNGDFKSVAKGRDLAHVTQGHDDNGGSAARFFYVAKASGVDRGYIPPESLPLFGEEYPEFRNTHPTVKPVALMRYLIRLVTPEGETILDPFAGSGTTLVAARELGHTAIGVEVSEEYVRIAVERLRE